MSRAPDQKIKEEILEKVLFVLSQKGLNNLSLRDIAREIDVSARMLIYHFGSYENLISSIVIQLSFNHKNLLKSILSENSNKSIEIIFRIFIDKLFTNEYRNTILLFLELYTKALRDINTYQKFFDVVLYEWIDEVEIVIHSKYKNKSKVYASMIVSFYRGLMLDWLVSNDKKRLIESSNTFTKLLQKNPSQISSF